MRVASKTRAVAANVRGASTSRECANCRSDAVLADRLAIATLRDRTFGARTVAKALDSGATLDTGAIAFSLHRIIDILDE